MELATLHLDTHKVVKLLIDKGYSEKSAEGFIEAIQEITLSGVATKHDVHLLRNELKDEMKKLATENIRFQLIQTMAIIGVIIALFTVF